jgi:hypothetical protein
MISTPPPITTITAEQHSRHQQCRADTTGVRASTASGRLGGALGAALSREDNNSPQLGRSTTSLLRGDIVKFHHEHSATFLSSQLISDSIATGSNYRMPQPIPTVPLARREPEKLGETMFLPTLIMLMVLSPVLLPALITAVHILTGQARTSTQDRVAANFPRMASSRLAVPAAA